MIEIRKKSALPIYGTALIWIVYCLFFPLYQASHFIWLIVISIAVYVILSKLIPDTVTYIEKEPVKTGDGKIDQLINDGHDFAVKMRDLKQELQSTPISDKISRLMELSDKIFDVLYDSPECYDQIKQFSGYFLPATLKLLTAYKDLKDQGVSGGNISASMDRIEKILDTTIAAYEKQLDALFARRALDIETDIEVLKNMMKSQGLSDSDFNV